jgi:hypothetical protein
VKDPISEPEKSALAQRDGNRNLDLWRTADGGAPGCGRPARAAASFPAGDFVAVMLPTGLEFFQSPSTASCWPAPIPVPIYPPTRPGQIEDHLRRQAGHPAKLRSCRH